MMRRAGLSSQWSEGIYYQVRFFTPLYLLQIQAEAELLQHMNVAGVAHDDQLFDSFKTGGQQMTVFLIGQCGWIRKVRLPAGMETVNR